MVGTISTNRVAHRLPLRASILRGLAGVAAILVVATEPCGAARGETSYLLPETVEAVATGVGIVRSPTWDRVAEKHYGGHDILAIGSGTVAFATDGALCGYAEADGKLRWCVAGGNDPAYAAGQVAFSLNDGGSASVDALDGRTRWRHDRGAKKFERVWAAGMDFLIQDERDTLSEVAPSGATLWSAEVFSTGDPLVVEPYAFFPQVSDGAYLSMNQRVVRLGRGGGAPDVSFTSWEIAAVALPYAFITLAPFEEVEDHFFTVDVGRVDVRSGTIDRQFHYEPDYDANIAPYSKTGIEGVSDTYLAPLRFDGAQFYATVGHNVYRYVFAEPGSQHPLLVSRDARLLGGPFRGAIFVRRRDGVWSLRPEAHGIRALLVAQSAAEVTSFTLSGNAGYVAFSDGSVRGFDAVSGRPLLAAKPCDRASGIRVGVSRSNVYVVCTAHGSPHVFAFVRT